ncbi:glucose-induced degradation complex subunit [Maudiozyma humilis]|uniref:Glucose-induced degradation complex subunit n=1 Tax=Maudiozyma humilis TaxID=51915 RepID=A0AAV5RW06_MAUHU|nr:glucose-induced degradation complex subunit [Kazachstania humilis]
MVAVCKNVLTGLGLISDEMELVSVLADPQNSVLDSLLGVSSRDDVGTQRLKLDNLLLLLSVERSLRENLQRELSVLIYRVFSEVKLYETLADNDVDVNATYLRVLNKCLDIRDVMEPIDISRHYESISLFFIDVVAELKYRVPQDPLEATLLIEMMRFLVIHQETTHIIDEPLRSAVKNMMQHCSNMYNYAIDFKFVIETKVTKGAASSDIPAYSLEGGNAVNQTYTVPKACVIENMYDREVIQYGLVLLTTTSPVHNYCYGSLAESLEFRVFVLSLLRQADVNLRCAALRFLIFPYIDNDNSVTTGPTSTLNDSKLRQFMPYLIKCFDSKLVPWWFDPFDNIMQLLEVFNKKRPLDNPIVTFLRDANLINGFMELFFVNLLNSDNSEESAKATTQLIRFFSCCAAFDERIRLTLLGNKRLVKQMKRDIQQHLGYLTDFSANKDIFAGINEDLPQLHNSQITFAWLQLLKSFSRSTSALRTTLRRNEILKELLGLVKFTSVILQTCYFAGRKFLQMEMDILGICQGCLCNFIVEFSTTDLNASDHDIVEMCAAILNDPLFNSKVPWRNLTRKMAFENINSDDVKTNTLWVVRHLMYNSQNNEKLDLLEKMSMDTLLDFINDPNWEVQQQCFQVLKNMTCNSRKVVNILLEHFRNVQYKINPHSGQSEAIGSSYLFEFLVRKIRLLDIHDNIQKKTLVAILYIIVNITAINEHKKQIVIEQDDVLEILHDILAEAPINNQSYGDSSELKLAVLWIIHNILWDPELMEYFEERHNNESNGSQISIAQENGSARSDNFPTEGSDMEQDQPETVNVNNVGSHSLQRDLPDTKAIERCGILRERGFYELVQEAAGNNDIGVRQKAAELLELMNNLSADRQI